MNNGIIALPTPTLVPSSDVHTPLPVLATTTASSGSRTCSSRVLLGPSSTCNCETQGPWACTTGKKIVEMYGWKTSILFASCYSRLSHSYDLSEDSMERGQRFLLWTLRRARRRNSKLITLTQLPRPGPSLCMELITSLTEGVDQFLSYSSTWFQAFGRYFSPWQWDKGGNEGDFYHHSTLASLFLVPCGLRRVT